MVPALPGWQLYSFSGRQEVRCASTVVHGIATQSSSSNQSGSRRFRGTLFFSRGPGRTQRGLLQLRSPFLAAAEGHQLLPKWSTPTSVNRTSNYNTNLRSFHWRSFLPKKLLSLIWKSIHFDPIKSKTNCRPPPMVQWLWHPSESVVYSSSRVTADSLVQLHYCEMVHYRLPYASTRVANKK